MSMPNEPINLEIIDADIFVATSIIEGQKHPVSPQQYNRYLINNCAYHAEQAIEKSLKFILYNDTGKETCGHNISELLVDIQDTRPNFIQEHREISKNSHFITNLNAARYGGRQISMETANRVLDMAKKLFNELCLEYGKPHYEKLSSSTKEDKNNLRNSQNAKKTDTNEKNGKKEYKKKKFYRQKKGKENGYEK